MLVLSRRVAVLACLALAGITAQPLAAQARGLAAPGVDVGALIQRLGLEEGAMPEVELLLAKDSAEAAALAPGAAAVLGLCTPELLAAGPDIRWIQAYSAGVERCLAIPALRERGVTLPPG